MTWPLAVVIIVLIVATAKVMAARFRAQAGIVEDERGNQRQVDRDTQEGREAQREIESLRERIKVLERIATDSNSLDANETRRISAEIDALRDRQAD